MPGVTHYLDLVRSSRTAVVAVGAASIGIAAFSTAASLTFSIRNMHTDGAAAHAESEVTFTEQSQMLTTALATGNWSYVTTALEIANEMVEHCIKGQQTETETANNYNTVGIMLSVFAIVSCVAMGAAYKYAAPKPGYNRIDTDTPSIS